MVTDMKSGPFFIWCKLWLLWLSIINGIVQFFAAHIPAHHVTNAWEPYSIDLILDSQGHKFEKFSDLLSFICENISLGHSISFLSSKSYYSIRRVVV